MPYFERKIIMPVLIFFIFCCMVVPSAAAEELGLQGYISEGDVLSPGDSISAEYTINYDFETSEESLQLYTGLIDPKWQIAIVIDGVYHVLPSSTGRYVNLGGFELFYDSSHSSQIDLTLTGTVPQVASSGENPVLRATWYDYAGEIVDEKTVQAVIVNPSEIESIQKTREDELETLKNFLNDKQATGVDTTRAAEKYNLAASAVSSAAKSESAAASRLLTQAEEYIEESYSLIYRSWADFSIMQAESVVNTVEGMISVYESKSLSDDSRVWVIRSYIDNADTLLILAKDKFNLSDYESSRNYAEQALSKAETGYNYAVSLNEEIDIDSPTIQTTPAKISVSAASTTSSGSSIDPNELIPDIRGDGSIEDLLQSEVDIESTLRILSMIGEGLMNAIDFLNNLMSMASDN